MTSTLITLALMTGDDLGVLLAAEYLRLNSTSEPPKFNFETYDEKRFKCDFRFFKDDVIRLVNAFNLPVWMKTKSGFRFRAIEGLCLLLRRLAYPNRLCDLQTMFGRSRPDLSNIITCMTDHLYTKYEDRVTNLNQWWLSKEWLKKYSEAIVNKGGLVEGCFGFIDGTIFPICRPTRFQKECYSGHKRTHCLKYQSVVLPNGLIANLYGPVSGRRHDSYMLKESKLMDRLALIIGADKLCLYGDAGYPLKKHLITPFLGNRVTPAQQSFNTIMSKLRIAVEWEFGDLTSQCAFLSYKYNLKIFLQPIGKIIKVATFIKNCHTCLYGCQTSFYFDVEPPTLEEYVNNVKDNTE